MLVNCWLFESNTCLLFFVEKSKIIMREKIILLRYHRESHQFRRISSLLGVAMPINVCQRHLRANRRTRDQDSGDFIIDSSGNTKSNWIMWYLGKIVTLLSYSFPGREFNSSPLYINSKKFFTFSIYWGYEPLVAEKKEKEETKMYLILGSWSW